MNGTFATTTGTSFSGPTACFLTRAMSFAGTGPCGVNSPFSGIGCVGQVFCSAFCGTAFSGIP